MRFLYGTYQLLRPDQFQPSLILFCRENGKASRDTPDGFTRYLIAQLARSMSPDELPHFKGHLHNCFDIDSQSWERTILKRSYGQLCS